ncbi:ABC transporter ATP-binding protein [Leptothoe kymatousa]|uniref:ABC transporter ATP-binding protein n=1 Tax=Leptothoe kymatousa TAU-MAC 1615 TaxID=2364775 RepID=A0ABS5XZU4_9CYAN|nr:ABC transporter ATP-binding protein [Leptothoe kymatousa]MBT9311117.1 ABC transporter ATP-binding protein [Leptothoe kymatousa TAU-MAC 1615]
MDKFLSILRYYRNYWPTTALNALAMGTFEILDLFVPYAIGQLLNVLSKQPLDQPLESFISWMSRVLERPNTATFSLWVILGLVCVISVGRAPIQPWIGAWFNWDTALRARRDQARRSLEKILTLPLEFYDENNPGRIAARVAKGLANYTWTYPEIVGQFIPKLFRVLGIFAVIACLDRPIALVVLISFTIILSYSLSRLKGLSLQEEKIDKYMENTESRTSEIITNIKTVKAFATETRELKRQHQRLNREFKVVDYRIHLGYVKLGTWQRTVVQSCTFGVLALTLWATVEGNISLGHFVTILTLSSMAYAEVEPICNLAEMFVRRYGAMARFQEFIALPAGTDAGQITGNPPNYHFTGQVHFHQLTFGYVPHKPVLQNIELLIQPRQTVALVGRSGSGKSTLVKLLFRYFEPDGGAILIDGQDLRHLDITGYRRRLAIVHQEVDIFNGTLMENLLYGNPDATVEQVHGACRIAQAHDFIENMPLGYFTTVGERGVRLSGGQRQRIGIARALIMDPDVLVFDEATSSLDYESERAIQIAMRSLFGTRTLIIIAHRLSTVREADQIVVLDQGHISEIGNHHQLLTQGGLYQRLHSLQQTGDIVTDLRE